MGNGQITAEELRALAARADKLAVMLESISVPTGNEALDPFLRERKQRIARAACLPGDLFREPAWDMLVDLMIARKLGKPISVSSLCIAARVPPTTALRHISVMEERGMIAREADRHDRRRFHLLLTDETVAGLERWAEGQR